MTVTARVSLLVLVVSALAIPAEAQCSGQPLITNFLITHSPTQYVLSWDPPSGISNPVYEILETTRPTYCPFPSNQSDYTVIATTTSTTYTRTKSVPNSAYFIFVRVQGNPCVISQYTYGADTFAAPPTLPVVSSATRSGSETTVSFNYNDTRTISIWLYRVQDQQFIDATGPCQANPKVLVDPNSPAGASYRLVAFNTGNQTGLNGVATAPFTPAATSGPPRVSFSVAPRVIRAGEAATLLWSTENATSVSISGHGQRPLSGSLDVTPATTTTYTLSATNSFGTTTAQVSVEVITVPEIVLVSVPEPMVQGTSAGGATTTYVLENVGGTTTAITLTQQGDFFTQSPTSFDLDPGERQVVTITGLQRDTGSFRGASNPAGAGVPSGMSVPVRLLSAPTPTGPTEAQPEVRRVDVSAPFGTNPTGSARFKNTGGATIQGFVVSSVPWLVPQGDLVEVAPGETVEVAFTIDRSRRPPTADLGSLEGSLSLVFRNPAAGKTTVAPRNGASASSSLVTVVDTSKPVVTPGQIPPLGPGEHALFIPGAGHLQGGAGLFFSDIALVNLGGSGTINNLSVYYTPTAAGSQTQTTSLSGLAAGTPLVFADVVSTVFGSQSTLGSLQIRGAGLDNLGVNANILLQTRGEQQQFYGNTIPALRSDRSANPGDSVFITGLTSTENSHTNLFLQETAGGTVVVDIDFLSESGQVLGRREAVEIAPFRLVGLFHSNQAPILPIGAVTAQITSRPTSSGRFGAYATPVDRRSGDSWSLVDWNSVNGFDGSEEMVIPVAGAVLGGGGLYFRTDLAVANRGNTPASGILRYISRPGEARPPIERTITLGARESTVIEDVTTTLFDLNPAQATIGYLTFTPGTGSMTVTSRNFATEGEDPGTFGTGVPTLARAASLKLGDVRRIGGVEDASSESFANRVPGTMRSNFAMMETSGVAPVTIRVTVYFTFATGTTAVARGSGSREYTLQPNEFVQISRVSREILGPSRDDFGDFDNLQVEFAVVAGEGSAEVLVSSVDNDSGDSTLRVE